VRLSDSVIANEKYRGEPTTDDEGRTQWPVCIVWDDEVQGLGIRIYPSVRGRPSRKDFIVTWKIGLKARYMALGTYGVDCTLRQARRSAREALDLARRGQDPIEARQRALGIGTAEDLASRFLFEHTAAKKKPVPGGESAAATPDADAVPAGGPAEPPPAVAVEAGAEESVPPPAETPPPTETPAELTVPPEGAANSVAAASTDESAAPIEPMIGPAGEDTSVTVTEPLEEVSAAAIVEASSEEPSAPVPPQTPPPTAASNTDARPKPPPTAPASLKRGPTKVRLLPVPDSLYRTIEHGARDSGMTIAAYLNALIEIARAAVGEDGEGHSGVGDADGPPRENGPSIGELFARVQEAQAVEVGTSAAGDAEDDEPSD
jgi:hypothetical protein